MKNYFNSLNLRQQLFQLSRCRFMPQTEFEEGCSALINKEIVIVGCGAQGLNQGLNMRDSGLKVSFALRESAITQKRESWKRATSQGFQVDTIAKLIPKADLVYNLTPDKQHAKVIEQIMPLMKSNTILAYSHGFNIVEQGQQIRQDISVIMCAPKCPGTEVREEFKRGFGVPTLIAVHPANDPHQQGLKFAKALACAIGGDRAGVLESSFVAEVKSDLMGEQTILCGMLQTASILGFDKMRQAGIAQDYSAQLIQEGLQAITEALKIGGITLMMNRLSNPAKISAYSLAEKIKDLTRPLFEKHMDNIISGAFSQRMIKDWHNEDLELLTWREQTKHSGFEKAPANKVVIDEQNYFEQGIFLIAMIKAGVEQAFELMLEAGMSAESAYYESLHETPLIANTIARQRLYEMNKVISDTAEYGNYLFCNSAIPLLQEHLMSTITSEEIGGGIASNGLQVNNSQLASIDHAIQSHPIEVVGKKLRNYMTQMRPII
ncbi:ketol-acid reductoisomerase [Aliikangiella sp. IMCC44653]